MLSRAFYQRPDVTKVAKELLGKILECTSEDGTSSGMIVEVEAYSGAVDRASHAFGFKRTDRTETMFKAGGVAYVYLCYGIHHLFNVVTNVEGQPDAVLVRAVQPIEGLELMKTRRRSTLTENLTSGPGKLTQALGIKTVLHNNLSLQGTMVRILDNPAEEAFEIVSTTRIGIDYAGADKYLPWRFYIQGNPFVSRI